MATTELRSKSGPKRTDRRAQKEKSTVKVRYGRRIRVEELRINDEIVTSWEGDEYSRRVAKSSKVETIDECASQWRTHIHVNRGHCYDIRCFVWIVAK